MSAERFFDDLARSLAEPMPRRRAVRVIGASLATLAIPGVSPRAARAAFARPGASVGLDQATCPDGSRCRTAGSTCCDRPSPASGGYVCVPQGLKCCCGNTSCNPATERCICPWPGGVGGKCVPKCALRYGHGYKDCGAVPCCAPHETCVNEERCESCEQRGEQTCRSYDGKSALICCPNTRAKPSCCANLTTAVCCGTEQTCKATRGPARCECPKGRRKCGLKCCKDKQVCCDEKCCPEGHVCEARFGVVDDFQQVIFTCKRRCGGRACGTGHCCGSGMRCQKGRCVVR